MVTKILIVDDDPVQTRLLADVVGSLGYESQVVCCGQQALDYLSNLNNKIDLVILDLVMPGMNGISVLKRLSAILPELPVILQTSESGVETVVEAMQAGAEDFIVKPVLPERLKISIRNALRMNSLAGELAKNVGEENPEDGYFGRIIAFSDRMKRVVDLAKRAAESSIPVLIEGESGVGKEVLAREIWQRSQRGKKSFVPVNCGALPKHLVESILFGHEKGSFTGANERHKGKFLEAHNGTIFLDEIGELPLSNQVKLLRVLQENEVDPVGGSAPIKINFRMISATNRSLQEVIKSGSFREDLYYRLNVFPISIPPLRERIEDIVPLAEKFLLRFSLSEKQKSFCEFSRDVKEMFREYSWPGNVRELENSIYRAVVLSNGGELKMDDFAHLENKSTSKSRFVVKQPTEIVHTTHHREMDKIKEEKAIKVESDEVSIYNSYGEVKTLSQVENDHIAKVLDHVGGSMTKAAQVLGIGRSTLYRRYSLVEDEEKAASDNLLKASAT